MGREAFFHGFEINLKILRLGGHHNQPATHGLHEAAVLREEGCKGQELILCLTECLEADGAGSSGTSCHEEILLTDFHAEALIDAFGDGPAGSRGTGSYSISMYGAGLHGLEDIHRRLFDIFRRGHIGVAQTEVKDFVLPLCRRQLAAIFKDIPDGGFPGA